MMSIQIVTSTCFELEIIEYEGPVMVFLEADWSGACHIVAPIIEDLAEVFKGEIKVCKLDVDQSRDVVQTYGVRGLPTLLFFRNGEIVDSHTGMISKEQLKAKLTILTQ